MFKKVGFSQTNRPTNVTTNWQTEIGLSVILLFLVDFQRSKSISHMLNTLQFIAEGHKQNSSEFVLPSSSKAQLLL